MSGMEAANLQMLARFYDAQREWLAMNWNSLISFPFSVAVNTSAGEKAEQLPLPGFPPQDNSSPL